MAAAIIDLLENEGLITEQQCHNAINKIRRDKLLRLRNDMIVCLKNKFYEDDFERSLFNFFASTSFRGDTCLAPRCRVAKIATVERFAALYSDRTVLPIKLGASQSDADSQLVLGSLLLLCKLRPLIDAGIIVPVSEGLCLCNRCHSSSYGKDSQLEITASRLADENASKVKVVYHGSKRGKHVFVVTCDNDLFEGLVITRQFEQMPLWLEGMSIKPGEILDPALVKKSKIGEAIYRDRLFDCTLQNYYADQAGCSYLSDSHSEASLLESIKSEAFEARFKALDVVNAMSHQIPMFADFPSSSLALLRKEMPEAFAAYRSALNQAVASQPSFDGGQNARQFYLDVIEPKLTALKTAEATAGKLVFRNLVTGLLPSAAVIAFGVLTGGAHDAGKLFEAIGGIGAVNSCIEPLKERNRRIADVRKDSFYFLLEVERRWRNQCERTHVR